MNTTDEKTIIAIIGPSGAGKDTFARMLSDKTGMPVLVSYTTRPMREGETDGVEHHFVKRACAKKKMLAYTEYGGYKYWTTMDQLTERSLYVIDEDGVRSIMDNHPELKVTMILVTASKDVRLVRGVSLERIARDSERIQFDRSAFAYVVKNNKSLDALKHQVMDITRSLTKPSQREGCSILSRSR